MVSIMASGAEKCTTFAPKIQQNDVFENISWCGYSFVQLRDYGLVSNRRRTARRQGGCLMQLILIPRS